MYTTLRDYRFGRDIDDIRGSAVYAPGEKLGKVDDVIFDSDNGQIRYLVVDTGGWLSSRRFLVPPEELTPSSTHDSDFEVLLTKAQIERFPALDEEVLEDKKNFESYEQRYSTSWAGSSLSAKKSTASTRLSAFQKEIVRNRSNICEPTGRRKVS